MGTEKEVSMASSPEKQAVTGSSSSKGASTTQIEHLENGGKDEGAVSHPFGNVEDYDKQRAAKLRHRIDFRLIPALAAMYAICLLDRNNLSNAAIAGMTVELKMVGE